MKKKKKEQLYEKEAKWAIDEIIKHVIREKKAVVENVNVDGSPLFELADGRLMNPGHAIECGWFLLQFHQRYYQGSTDFKSLPQVALEIIDWSFESGWDKENGGLLYFLDVLGYTPTQLEWNMKLWWPHTESMIAFLSALQHTKEWKYFTLFKKVTDYSLKTFASSSSQEKDTDSSKPGEWYGYCDQFGTRTHQFVGGPYKGCFHVPRGLLFSIQLLDSILKSNRY